MVLLAKLKGTRSNSQILLMPVHLESILSTVFHNEPLPRGETAPCTDLDPALSLSAYGLPHL